MAGTRPIVLVLLALWLPAAAAAESTLLILQSTTDADVALEVPDRNEAQLADPPVTAPVWRLAPGDSVSAPRRPPDRVVELYSGTPQAPDLVARIVLRYFPAASGWKPHFILREVPVVHQVDGRWQPLLLPGAAGLLLRHGNTLPNADGFFPALEFGLGTGELALVAWRVRPVSPLQTIP